MERLMIAAFIPQNYLTELAERLHKLRVKWDLPQFCHRPEEIKGLYAQDEGFLGLQSVSKR